MWCCLGGKSIFFSCAPFCGVFRQIPSLYFCCECQEQAGWRNFIALLPLKLFSGPERICWTRVICHVTKLDNFFRFPFSLLFGCISRFMETIPKLEFFISQIFMPILHSLRSISSVCKSQQVCYNSPIFQQRKKNSRDKTATTAHGKISLKTRRRERKWV